MEEEFTLAIIKPDAVVNGHVGSIIKRFESQNIRIAGMMLSPFPEEVATALYAEHIEKDFFDGLIKFMTSGPLVVMVLRGEDAVDKVRQTMVGIREDFGEPTGPKNAVHTSDSKEAAIREISLLFKGVARNDGS